MTRIGRSLYPDSAAWTTGNPISTFPIVKGAVLYKGVMKLWVNRLF